MPSLPTRLVNRVSTLALKSFRGDAAGFVKRFRLVTRMSSLIAPIPKGLQHKKAELGGVPGEWLIPPNPKGSMLYIHGGAFVAGSPTMYRPFCGKIARSLGLRVFMVDYRLAPEFPFPVPLDDCIAAFDALADLNGEGAPLLVAGDSAGGNLTMAVLQHDLAHGKKATGGVLISPTVDARVQAPSITGNDASDSMLSAHIIEHAARVYLNGHKPEDPRASPLLGEMKGLPPILSFASNSECLRDDTLLLAKAIEKAGGKIKVHTRDGMPHIWPVMIALLPEAREDLKITIDFIASTF